MANRIQIHHNFGNQVDCYTESRTGQPLIVSRRSNSNVVFHNWAHHHKAQITEALKVHGAILFHNFDIKANEFGYAYTCATGSAPEPYKGDVPRKQMPEIFLMNERSLARAKKVIAFGAIISALGTISAVLGGLGYSKIRTFSIFNSFAKKLLIASVLPILVGLLSLWIGIRNKLKLDEERAQLKKHGINVGNCHRNVFLSTAVASMSALPLHQEVSFGRPDIQPDRIGFFCATAPTNGTGRTLVGNTAKISAEIERRLPNLWRKLQTNGLVFTATYRSEKGFRNWLHTHYLQTLNPTETSIKKRFGLNTEDRAAVEAKCREEGVQWQWVGDEIKITHGSFPGVSIIDGVTLLRSPFYNNIYTPKLFGGWFFYKVGTTLLYPDEKSSQFTVKFDDGTKISQEESTTVLEILEEHQDGVRWEEGSFLLVDNATTMHGAERRDKAARLVFVAMSGSVTDVAQFPAPVPTEV